MVCHRAQANTYGWKTDNNQECLQASGSLVGEVDNWMLFTRKITTEKHELLWQNN